MTCAAGKDDESPSNIDILADSVSPTASGSRSFSFATEDISYYSPPPSGTRLSSISRFSTPKMVRESGTPSLLNFSLASTVSSPSLALTPMQYDTTNNPEVSNIGLGLSGLFLRDEVTFDNADLLPKPGDQLSDMGFFVDDLEGTTAWFGQDSFAHPEQVEDAWRKRISLSVDASTLDVFRDLEESSLDEGSSKKGADQEYGLESPDFPMGDDVFYSHGPLMSSTPRKREEKRARGWRSSMSHAMVSDWRRSVHLEEQEGMAGFY